LFATRKSPTRPTEESNIKKKARKGKERKGKTRRNDQVHPDEKIYGGKREERTRGNENGFENEKKRKQRGVLLFKAKRLKTMMMMMMMMSERGCFSGGGEAERRGGEGFSDVNTHASRTDRKEKEIKRRIGERTYRVEEQIRWKAR